MLEHEIRNVHGTLRVKSTDTCHIVIGGKFSNISLVLKLAKLEVGSRLKEKLNL